MEWDGHSEPTGNNNKSITIDASAISTTIYTHVGAWKWDTIDLNTGTYSNKSAKLNIKLIAEVNTNDTTSPPP